jgi:hypothetical protein
MLTNDIDDVLRILDGMKPDDEKEISFRGL